MGGLLTSGEETRKDFALDCHLLSQGGKRPGGWDKGSNTQGAGGRPSRRGSLERPLWSSAPAAVSCQSCRPEVLPRKPGGRQVAAREKPKPQVQAGVPSSSSHGPAHLAQTQLERLLPSKLTSEEGRPGLLKHKQGGFQPPFRAVRQAGGQQADCQWPAGASASCSTGPGEGHASFSH